MKFAERVKERYFKLKAKRCNITEERCKTLVGDRLPSDQIKALIQILTEELNLNSNVQREVKFVKLLDTAKLPSQAYSNDAGNDLYASVAAVIKPGQRVPIETGIAWVPPTPRPGYKFVMIVQSRSGLAFKKDIEASNAGVIDQGFRDEIGVMLQNNSDEDFVVKVGDKIAQGIISEIPALKIVEGTIDDLKTKEDRNLKGYGSSANK